MLQVLVRDILDRRDDIQDKVMLQNRKTPLVPQGEGVWLMFKPHPF